MPHVRSTLLCLICLLGLAALAPAGAAAGPRPPVCPIYAPHAAAEQSLTLLNGTKLIARDPYGGLLPRNRLFFDFTVQKAGGGRGPQGVAQVTWALDGTVVRTDPTAPYEWKGLSSSSRRMPAGDHQITVSVTPDGGGAPVSTTFALTATDCQPAGMFANLDVNLPGRSGSTAPSWTPGPPSSPTTGRPCARSPSWGPVSSRGSRRRRAAARPAR
jgi:hypothetical protein